MTLEKVKNKEKDHHLESENYWFTEMEGGTPLLFIKSEITSAMERAKRKPDVRPQLQWWSKMFGRNGKEAKSEV